MKKGILTVISGFSGVGKGTIVKELVSSGEYALSVSATSRSPRTGEENGREYFFLTREEFKSMINDNGLIEWAEYVGNFYGTPRKYTEEKLAAGENVILEIEPQGAMKVKKQYPEAVLIFVVPPSANELERRLTERGTEDKNTIRKRLKRAAEETEFIENYDYIVINDDLVDAVKSVEHIIKSARLKRETATEFLKLLEEDLKKQG